eukprot:CAMPEP_0119414282 /NCGR_PEP_ID=MMETSP1335-20130426/6755_1 /TAXON_ID=259385 /ORGANISM="Chrysoculter rhomboideus, Strain RCC1486" /LENGTH=122 /DNA_ID=CAMNT_0007439153 /DNA_START=69 /DNA_END=437 /DNA_ORIENTATION=-
MAIPSVLASDEVCTLRQTSCRAAACRSLDTASDDTDWRCPKSHARRLVEQVYRGENVVLVRLDDAAIHQHLIDDKVRFFQVEHDVELAYILKVPIKCLYKGVNELQNRQLVLVVTLDTDDEE